MRRPPTVDVGHSSGVTGDDERRNETAAERAARWAAESAEVKPLSRRRLLLRHALDEGLPRLLAGVALVALVGGIAIGGWAFFHRDQNSVGRLAPGTCLPDDAILSDDDATSVDTVDCDEPHRGEVFLSLKLDPLSSVSTATCDGAWATTSDVPVSVSHVTVGLLTVGDVGSVFSDEALCVAVGPEPVEGREALNDWQP